MEKILPGKSIKNPTYDQVGIMFSLCPFCEERVTSEEYPPHEKCVHLSRIVGGCGVAAAFVFTDPPQKY